MLNLYQFNCSGYLIVTYFYCFERAVNWGGGKEELPFLDYLKFARIFMVWFQQSYKVNICTVVLERRKLSFMEYEWLTRIRAINAVPYFILFLRGCWTVWMRYRGPSLYHSQDLWALMGLIQSWLTFSWQDEFGKKRDYLSSPWVS